MRLSQGSRLSLKMHFLKRPSKSLKIPQSCFWVPQSRFKILQSPLKSKEVPKRDYKQVKGYWDRQTDRNEVITIQEWGYHLFITKGFVTDKEWGYHMTGMRLSQEKSTWVRIKASLRLKNEIYMSTVKCFLKTSLIASIRAGNHFLQRLQEKPLLSSLTYALSSDLKWNHARWM